MIRSIASPRAVSISTGVSARARSRRQTSSPSMSGSVRSSTRASNGSRASRSSPSLPLPAAETRKPAWPRYSDTISARRGSSSISRMRAATRAVYLSAPVPAAAAHALHALRELLALQRREHLGGVRERVGDALGGLLGELHLLGAQLLERGPVHVVAGEKVHRLQPRLAQAAAQRHEVLRRALDDRPELLLLRLGGVDLDVKVRKPAVQALVELGRVERSAAPAAGAAPMGEGAQSEPAQAGERAGDRGATEETAPRGLLCVVLHGCSLVIATSGVCTLPVSAPSP